MLNRLFGLLILAVFVFVGFVYFFGSEVNEQNNTGGDANTVIGKQQVSKTPEFIKGKTINSPVITKNKNLYKRFAFGKKDTFDFVIKNGKIVASVNRKAIGQYPLISANDISISQVRGVENQYIISFGKKRYVYSTDAGFIGNFSMKLAINYIKKSGLSYLVSTEKGIFEYDASLKRYEYKGKFPDFTYKDGKIISYVSSSDKKLLQEYRLTGKNTIIFSYNPKTKEIKKLIDTELGVNKIFTKNSTVVVETKGGSQYMLRNY